MKTTNATIVKFEEISNGGYIFRIDPKNTLTVKLTDDENTIRVQSPIRDVKNFIKTLAGCFLEDSNFEEEFSKACGRKEITTIEFTFNGITPIYEKNLTAQQIYEVWEKKWNEKYGDGSEG